MVRSKPPESDMVELDGTSHTIGSISGKLDAYVEVTNGMLREMRADIKTIVSSMSNLPPSPVCEKRYDELSDEIVKIKLSNARRGGILAGVATIGSVAIQWILSQVGIVIHKP